MAEKEATVYIVDVGRCMGEKHQSRSLTDLEWAMQYVWDRITTGVATGRKTIFTGVVGLRTNDTNNELNDDDGFEHLSVFQYISQILMQNIRNIRDAVTISDVNEGDPISALVLAIQLISNHCRKLKYKRKIILVTNARNMNIDADDLEAILSKIRDDTIELTVLGVDFDDNEFGFKEEGKDPSKVSIHETKVADNERVLRTLSEGCDGIFGTMAQAVKELEVPRVKSTKPVHSYKGELTLGDPEDHENTMRIGVERYPRTMVAKPPTASQFVVATGPAVFPSSSEEQGTKIGLGPVSTPDPKKKEIGGNEFRNSTDDELAAVKNQRKYQVTDETMSGGKRDVSIEDLAKGYEYGRTAVHISESDLNVTTFETTPGLEIIGFIPQEKHERFLDMSRSNIIVAQRGNDKASMALSSLIHALYELEIYAIARLVTRINTKPLIILLAPSIESGGSGDGDSGNDAFECLTDIELPFAEDIRQYKFPPLDKVKTVSGKVLISEHRNLPDEKLNKAMSDYVESMNLDEFGKDEDGNPTEYAALDDTYSPVLHRVLQVIRRRAVYPTKGIPSAPKILTKYSKAPDALVKEAKPHLDQLIVAADVKKVPPRARGRKRIRPADEPLSGLDVDALLGSTSATGGAKAAAKRISRENAIPEFKQLLASTEDISTIKDAAAQMSAIIRSYIQHSVGNSGYGRALEAMRVMREEMEELEEPEIWNDFVREVKKELLGGQLGGNRKEMWWLVRGKKIGLIDKRCSTLSDVGEEEAANFLKTT